MWTGDSAAALRRLGKSSPTFTSICPQDVYEPILRRRAEAAPAARRALSHASWSRSTPMTTACDAVIARLGDGREQTVRAAISAGVRRRRQPASASSSASRMLGSGQHRQHPQRLLPRRPDAATSAAARARSTGSSTPTCRASSSRSTTPTAGCSTRRSGSGRARAGEVHARVLPREGAPRRRRCRASRSTSARSIRGSCARRWPSAIGSGASSCSVTPRTAFRRPAASA